MSAVTVLTATVARSDNGRNTAGTRAERIGTPRVVTRDTGLSRMVRRSTWVNPLMSNS